MSILLGGYGLKEALSRQVEELFIVRDETQAFGARCGCDDSICGITVELRWKLRAATRNFGCDGDS
jgi:hypothetical protein